MWPLVVSLLVCEEVLFLTAPSGLELLPGSVWMLCGWQGGKGPQVQLAKEEVALSGVGGGNRSLVGTNFAPRRSDFIVCTGIGDGAVDVRDYDLPVDG